MRLTLAASPVALSLCGVAIPPVSLLVGDLPVFIDGLELTDDSQPGLVLGLDGTPPPWPVPLHRCIGRSCQTDRCPVWHLELGVRTIFGKWPIKRPPDHQTTRDESKCYINRMSRSEIVVGLPLGCGQLGVSTPPPRLTATPRWRICVGVFPLFVTDTVTGRFVGRCSSDSNNEDRALHTAAQDVDLVWFFLQRLENSSKSEAVGCDCDCACSCLRSSSVCGRCYIGNGLKGAMRALLTSLRIEVSTVPVCSPCSFSHA
jgi:hypothetical protein